MAEKVGFRCNNCGNGFVIDVLTPPEVQERQRLNLPCGPIRCPTCSSPNVEKVRRAA